MTRRRILVFALLASLLAMGQAVMLLWPQSAITRENAAKIQVGMTLSEVEMILGGSARDESTGPGEIDPANTEAAEVEWAEMESQKPRREDAPGIAVSYSLMWTSDAVALFATFSADDRVTGCSVVWARRSDESLFHHFRRWLRL